MSFVESKPMDDDITSAKPLHGADLQEMSAPRNEVCRRVSLNWRHVSVILVGRFLFSVNHSFLVSCSRAKNESMLKPFFSASRQCQRVSLRRDYLKLFKPRCKITARQKFFSIRVVNEWNRLPVDLIRLPYSQHL